MSAQARNRSAEETRKRRRGVAMLTESCAHGCMRRGAMQRMRTGVRACVQASAGVRMCARVAHDRRLSVRT
eukprot:262086-Pleurochrysis_carterae.AAC.1